DSGSRSVRRLLPRPKVSCEYSRTFGAGDAARCGFRSRSTMAAFIGLRMYVVHQNSLSLGGDDFTGAKKDHERAQAENAVAECAASDGRSTRWLDVMQRR